MLRTATRRHRRRSERPPLARTLARAGAAIAVVGVLLYLSVVSYNAVPGRSYTHIYADLPNVGSLATHSPVRIGGVRVGQVLAVKPAPVGGARVTLQLDRQLTLPADSGVLIRANGLLGARYVQVLPGDSTHRLAEGDTIAAPSKAMMFGVSEALDTFDAPTRTATGVAVRELGDAVLGRGADLNQLIGDVPPAADDLHRLTDAVLTPPGALRRLIPSLRQAVEPLDRNRRNLADILDPAATSLQPFVDRAASVRSTLERAPAALESTSTGLNAGVELLSATRTLLAQANRTLPRAPLGLHRTATLLRESHGTLDRTTRLLDAAGPAVPAALRFTSALNPLLPRLTTTFSSLTPVLRELADHECDITNFGAVFRSMTGYGGYGSGPLGPPGEFRLQVEGSLPTEYLGIKDTTGLVKREAYSPPCSYLSGPYPTTDDPLGGGR
ncbi:MAG: Mammalian cell entry related domain protein [Solirubrobacterales bacterium]|nr:Mammalian cell entry related domain protein [Solirubrobacterales bacterium]